MMNNMNLTKTDAFLAMALVGVAGAGMMMLAETPATFGKLLNQVSTSTGHPDEGVKGLLSRVKVNISFSLAD